MTPEDEYLIWSNEHRAWWAPNRNGYIDTMDRAGRYSREEAIKISSFSRDGWGKSIPPEMPIRRQDAEECQRRFDEMMDRK